MTWNGMGSPSWHARVGKIACLREIMVGERRMRWARMGFPLTIRKAWGEWSRDRSRWRDLGMGFWRAKDVCMYVCMYVRECM